MGDGRATVVDEAAQLIREGQLAEAVGKLTAWIVEHPQDGRALELLGVAYSKLGQWDEAEAACAKRVRVNGTSADARANWATALRKLGREDQAREAAESALDLDPGHARALRELDKLGPASTVRGTGIPSPPPPPEPQPVEELTPPPGVPAAQSSDDVAKSEWVQWAVIGLLGGIIATVVGLVWGATQTDQKKRKLGWWTAAWGGVWVLGVYVAVSMYTSYFSGILDGAVSGVPAAPTVRVLVTSAERAASVTMDSIATIEPAQGNTYWCFGLSVTNAGTQAHHANPNNVTLVAAGGYTYSYSSATHALTGRDFPAVDLQPGNTASGYIVFEVPGQATPSELIYTPMMGTPVRCRLQ